MVAHGQEEISDDRSTEAKLSLSIRETKPQEVL